MYLDVQLKLSFFFIPQHEQIIVYWYEYKAPLHWLMLYTQYTLLASEQLPCIIKM